MIEVVVARLGLDSSTNSYVIVLQERGGTRLLPIWIGQPEAESIVMHMQNVKRARPLTHDLIRNLLVGIGAQLRRVQITRVEKGTYFAELQIQRGDALVHVDARPSDSIAIALRMNAPVYVTESLLVDPAADDADESETPEFGASPDLPGSSAELSDEQLSAEQLKRYLEALRPEDFGKFNP